MANAATPKTAQLHTVASAAVISLDNPDDFERANRGLIATHPTGVIGDGTFPAYDVNTRDFLRQTEAAPDTVHPNLWRQARLNAIHGLFEVVPGVWQARGYDIANITFIAGDTGWVIIDPLTVEATAAECLKLANETLGERPVVAVIYTHSHRDHYGGVLGVTSREAVDAGECRVIAPEGFMQEAVGENIVAGSIMARRSFYQFGPLLPVGPTGQVDCGLGNALPLGAAGLIAPTELIVDTGTELDVDGVRIVFQNTPGGEAPAEMNFHFPDLGVLCMAENCCHTMHNLYPIRGAQVRDSLSWSKYINEAIQLFADDTEIMFASHHWPRFGKVDVREFLELQRDLYRWMHDQAMRRANKGMRAAEIAEDMVLPAAFGEHSHVTGLYGSLSHNVKSVYNRYLGWYDGNPANLHPHPPVPSAERYVEFMGGADAVLEKARVSYAEGDYRWVAQVVNHVVFADPGNQDARDLQADALEQMGYQAESSTWRNAYLQGATDLREGSPSFGPIQLGPVAPALSAEQLMDTMGVRFDPDAFDGSATFAITFTDLSSDVHTLGVARGVICHTPGAPAAADATVGITRLDLASLLMKHATLADLVSVGSVTVDGDTARFAEYLDALELFTIGAKIIEP